MIIRQLEQMEILPALHLVWEVFVQDVAEAYSRQGVEEFQNFIKYENIMKQVSANEMVLFGAYEGNELQGTGAVLTGGHISLLFVKKEHQRKGIGRRLFTAMCQYCVQAYAITRITVNSAPQAVETYRHLGMRETGPLQMANGIQFVPMEMMLAPASMKAAPIKKRNAWLIAAVVAGCAVTFFLVAVFLVGVVREMRSEISSQHKYDYNENYDGHRGSDTYDYDDNNGDDSDEPTGIDAIPEYEADNLDYEITRDNYTYNSKETTRTAIQFEVYFPKLEGLEKEIQEKVNASLKECAMESAERLYLNPSEETKEEVLGQKYPVLASFVDYKVSYMSNEFISVVFQDYNYQIDGSSYHISLRTRNISLKDGKVYEVKDIVNLSDEFVEEWLGIMREEAEQNPILSELSTADLKAVLNGDDKGGIYQDNFFVDAKGIEIGLSLEYPKDHESDLGYSWVTAPFEIPQLKEYKTDSEFWKYVEK